MDREPWFVSLRERAEREPLGVDISDYSDEFCAGFLAGQVAALDAAVEERYVHISLCPCVFEEGQR